jgi:xanthine dehydrogenase molybdenum-binding subunit
MVYAIVADELGLNPIEVMRKNDGSLGHDRAWIENYMDEYGFDSSRNSLEECIAACNQTVDMQNNWHPPGAKILPNGKYHGFGFTVHHQWTHILGDKGGSYIGLALRNDGTCSILALRGDQGTGFQSSWVRAAADELGMKIEDVDIEGIHDEQYFHAHDEGCSGGTISKVMSISKAARKLKQWILEAATFDETVHTALTHGSWSTTTSLFPDLTPDEMDIKDSVVFEKANPDNSATLRQVAQTIDTGAHGGEYRRLLFDWGWTRNTDPVLDPDEFDHGYPSLCRFVHFCEVEVDPETGRVDVISGASAHDMGKAFDPEACEQEQFGGFSQGNSRSGLEEQFYDPLTGVQLNDNLIFYPIGLMNDCAFADAPLIETGGGYGPYGATGNGESSGAGAQSLIPTAVHNAIGKWVDLPCTPDRILKALGKI